MAELDPLGALDAPKHESESDVAVPDAAAAKDLLPAHDLVPGGAVNATTQGTVSMHMCPTQNYAARWSP